MGSHAARLESTYPSSGRMTDRPSELPALLGSSSRQMRACECTDDALRPLASWRGERLSIRKDGNVFPVHLLSDRREEHKDGVYLWFIRHFRGT